MVNFCYNYTSNNQINSRDAVVAASRPLHQKGKFLMPPQYITLKGRAKNITGQRFGRLVALGPVGRTRQGGIVWLCQCDCGNTAEVWLNGLTSDQTMSCGCLYALTRKYTARTHGKRHTLIYETWNGIRGRCNNKKHKSYSFYGGRGITMYAEWQNSFENFFDYVSCLPDYGQKGSTLDRIDTGGNYEPGNVRWVSMTIQNRNSRKNRMITYKGKTQCLSAWAEEVHLTGHCLKWRLNSGWDIERALTTPSAR